jgi:hypothetical protein
MWNLIKFIPFRTIGWTVLAGSVVLALSFGYNAIYNAGYEQAKHELEADSMIAINNAVEKARLEWKKSSRVASDQLNQERKLLERIHEIEKRIDLAVNSVGPDCRLLGNDVLGLFNSAVQAANSIGPADTAKPSEGVR